MYTMHVHLNLACTMFALALALIVYCTAPYCAVYLYVRASFPDAEVYGVRGRGAGHAVRTGCWYDGCGRQAVGWLPDR